MVPMIVKGVILAGSAALAGCVASVGGLLNQAKNGATNGATAQASAAVASAVANGKGTVVAAAASAASAARGMISGDATTPEGVCRKNNMHALALVQPDNSQEGG